MRPFTIITQMIIGFATAVFDHFFLGGGGGGGGRGEVPESLHDARVLSFSYGMFYNK